MASLPADGIAAARHSHLGDGRLATSRTSTRAASLVAFWSVNAHSAARLTCGSIRGHLCDGARCDAAPRRWYDDGPQQGGLASRGWLLGVCCSLSDDHASRTAPSLSAGDARVSVASATPTAAVTYSRLAVPLATLTHAVTHSRSRYR